MKRLLTVVGTCCALLTCTGGEEALAQNRYDVLRYSVAQPGNDAVSTAFGGATTAFASGFGASSENPAVLAMMKSSTFNFGVNNRRIEEYATFMNSQRLLNQGTLTIADLGFVYSIPTLRGSMVIGGGYNRIADFTRGFTLRTRNNESTITDSFSDPGSPYYDLGFRNAYFDLGDGDYSIFRLADYVGIDQDSEQTETGQLGELNFFAATEVAPNLFVGGGLAIPFGFYRYQRYWLEEDTRGDYWGEFSVEYPNGDIFYDDVFDVYLRDEINASITGFYARLGLAYQVQPWFNLGASYRTPTRLTVREDYWSRFEMAFDNGDFVGPDVMEGKIDYKVRTPGRFSVGAAIDDLNGLIVTGSAEYVPYSKASMEFKGGTSDEVRYARDENDRITQEFNDVWNLKLGAGFRAGLFEPRVGYSLYPAVSKDFGDDLATYSAGLGISPTRDITLNLSFAYTNYKDTQTLYTSNVTGAENILSDVKRFQVVAGLVFKF